MPSLRAILAFFCAIIIVMLGPIIGWPIVSSSTEVGLVVGVGLVVLIQPRWAWTIVVIAAIIDESRSVAPVGMHLLAGLIGLATASLAHQKLLSGHSQTQVAVLVAMAILSSQAVMIVFRSVAVVAHADWLVPHIADTLQRILPSLIWTGLITFCVWPFIRRRWMPLQRITSWI